AAPLAGAALAVAGAVGILGRLAGPTGQGGVEEIDKQAVGDLLLQEMLPQDRVDVELAPSRACQEAADLSPMPRRATDRAAGAEAGHPAGVDQEGGDDADDQ